MVPLVQQVMRQTKTRVFAGDPHAEGKIVSLFEPTTEVIRKGKAGKPTEFGKMVKLQEAENQIVIAYQVYDQRPSDQDILMAAIETHQTRLGRTAAPGGRRCRFLLGQKRSRGKGQGRQPRVHPQSLHQEPGAQARAEEALVPQWAEVADRLRGPHQRGQATARTEPQPIQRRGQYEALGWPRPDRRQSGQHQPRHG
jgi:hypothetical protein